MTSIPPGAVTIADLYRELSNLRAEVTRALTRIEVLDDRDRTTEGSRVDHEQRIRALETWRWKVAGVSATIGALAGALATWVGIAVSHH